MVIYTYNGTGYLELMASNYPVLLLWSNKDNPLNAETEIFFNELKEAKIFIQFKIFNIVIIDQLLVYLGRRKVCFV